MPRAYFGQETPEPIRVTIWNEFRHERNRSDVKEIYPEGLHAPIAKYLTERGVQVCTAALDDPEHGLSDEVLRQTDVLVWWGHMYHQEVQDEIVERVYQRVLSGMGLVVLHSGHFSKIFTRLMGTTCNLKWRDMGEKERLWVVQPAHPIAAGVSEYVEIEAEEMYGEFFDIPQPTEVVFVSWFEGGEVFRSGVTFTRGRGKIFYFRPGHETYPTYHNEQVLHIIANGIQWAGGSVGCRPTFGNVEPLDPLTSQVA